MDNTGLWLIVVGIATAAMGLALMYSIWKGASHERSIRKLSQQVQKASEDIDRLSGQASNARVKTVDEDDVVALVPQLPMKENVVAQTELQLQFADILLRVKQLEHEVAALNVTVRSSIVKPEHAQVVDDAQGPRSFEELAGDIRGISSPFSSRLKPKQDKSNFHSIDKPGSNPGSYLTQSAGAAIPPPIEGYIVMHQPEPRGLLEAVPLALCSQFESRRLVIVIDEVGEFRLRLESPQTNLETSYLFRDFAAISVTLDELPQQRVQCAVLCFTRAKREHKVNLMFCIPTTSPFVDELVHFLDSTFSITVVKYPRTRLL